MWKVTWIIVVIVSMYGLFLYPLHLSLNNKIEPPQGTWCAGGVSMTTTTTRLDLYMSGSTKEAKPG